jgi:hypothetical protein
MSKFKFTEEERSKISDILLDLTCTDIVSDIDRIESIISERWVSDKIMLKECDTFCDIEEGPYSRYTAFVEGAQWMRSRIFKNDQQ